ncbi:uncharacterized protein P884DRAFT_271406 [Thermothelomyces heterothallicus CBS 202.75]|uniref:uncharacterized protein n=1 Tax=Thermothelomyces heterothallicus CBS 202.75 TaxID=1149848 RepID=UPI00374304C4
MDLSLLVIGGDIAGRILHTPSFFLYLAQFVTKEYNLKIRHPTWLHEEIFIDARRVDHDARALSRGCVHLPSLGGANAERRASRIRLAGCPETLGMLVVLYLPRFFYLPIQIAESLRRQALNSSLARPPIHGAPVSSMGQQTARRLRVALQPGRWLFLDMEEGPNSQRLGAAMALCDGVRVDKAWGPAEQSQASISLGFADPAPSRDLPPAPDLSCTSVACGYREIDSRSRSLALAPSERPHHGGSAGIAAHVEKGGHVV